jgi:hypothetical protein
MTRLKKYCRGKMLDHWYTGKFHDRGEVGPSRGKKKHYVKSME